MKAIVQKMRDLQLRLTNFAGGMESAQGLRGIHSYGSVSFEKRRSKEENKIVSYITKMAFSGFRM
jgi:hypothetical protein